MANNSYYRFCRPRTPSGASDPFIFYLFNFPRGFIARHEPDVPIPYKHKQKFPADLFIFPSLARVCFVFGSSFVSIADGQNFRKRVFITIFRQVAATPCRLIFRRLAMEGNQICGKVFRRGIDYFHWELFIIKTNYIASDLDFVCACVDL